MREQELGVEYVLFRSDVLGGAAGDLGHVDARRRGQPQLEAYRLSGRRVGGVP